jgi:hypothetical protein
MMQFQPHYVIPSFARDPARRSARFQDKLWRATTRTTTVEARAFQAGDKGFELLGL